LATEESKIEEAPQIIEDEPVVDFDTWFALRSSRIPLHHHKEIIRADFKGRGVPTIATVEVFDNALKKYGIKLD
jgi:hypothetical protein